MKKFFARYKGVIAAMLCFTAAVAAGYMIQKKQIERDIASSEEEEAFVARSKEAASDVELETERETENRPRALPEAFPDDGEREPLVTKEEAEALLSSATDEFAPVMPIEGAVTKSFSSAPLYSVTLDDWRSHEALDISAEEGDAVTSVEKGRVSALGTDPLLGVYVRIDHGNGFESLYANLHTELTVTEGQSVEVGHRIGYVGKTSVLEQAEAEHLHFELRKDGINVNPKEYIK